MKATKCAAQQRKESIPEKNSSYEVYKLWYIVMEKDLSILNKGKASVTK